MVARLTPSSIAALEIRQEQQLSPVTVLCHLGAPDTLSQGSFFYELLLPLRCMLWNSTALPFYAQRTELHNTYNA